MRKIEQYKGKPPVSGEYFFNDKKETRGGQFHPTQKVFVVAVATTILLGLSGTLYLPVLFISMTLLKVCAESFPVTASCALCVDLTVISQLPGFTVGF